MLPSAVVDTARRAVRVAMDEQRESLAREVADIYRHATVAGALHSGRLLVAVKDRLASEYKIRAMMAWEIWARLGNAGHRTNGRPTPDARGRS